MTQNDFITFRYTTKVLTELTPGENAIKDSAISQWVNETLTTKGKSSKISSFKVCQLYCVYKYN